MYNMSKKVYRIVIRSGKMSTVISLSEYRKSIESRVSSYSLLDLLSDPKKQRESDEYYTKNYKYIESDDFSKKMFTKDDIKEG